jgi:hypothetical protein
MNGVRIRPLKDLTDARFRQGAQDERDRAQVHFCVPREGGGYGVLCRETAPASVRTHDEAAAWARSLPRNAFNAGVPAFFIQFW